MSELDQVMGQIESKYDVEVVPLRIGGKTLNVLQFKDFESHLEELIEGKGAGIMDLPYWAKVWESSFLLAFFLGNQPVVMGQRILEIGAGIGIVGIYAALCGHRITITDINDDALLFAKANALLNGLPHLEIRKLDWNDPELPECYDIIVGSEVVYTPRSYPLLVDFLQRALTSTGMIFLSKNADLNTPAFFTELIKHFEFKQTTQTVSTDGESQRISIYAIRRKLSQRSNAGE